MNFNRHIRCLLMLLSVISLHSCGYDSFERLDATPHSTPLPNADMSYLRQNYADGSCVITENLILSGVVTSSDRSGNFYKSFFVQDGSGAMEIYAGLYDLHNIYPVGQRVTINAKGLALCLSNGVVRLGLSVDEWSSYNVDSFGTRSVIDRYVLRNDSSEPVAAEELRLGNMKQTDCGKLVKIYGVDAAVKDLPWAEETTVGTYSSSYSVRIFTDADENEIAVVTSIYATFADRIVPSGKINLTGILMYGKFGASKERYVVKLRDLNDVETE